MMAEGDVVSVGAIRRELAALPDDAPVVVSVTDGYGREAPAESVGAHAAPPGYGRAWMEVRVAETLSWDEPYMGTNPLASAWEQVVERGQCPASMLADLVAGLLCRTAAPVPDCRSAGCAGCLAHASGCDEDIPF